MYLYLKTYQLIKNFKKKLINIIIYFLKKYQKNKNSLLFLDCNSMFYCGLSCIVPIKKRIHHKKPNIISLLKMSKFISSQNYSQFQKKHYKIPNKYLGGDKKIKNLLEEIKFLKRDSNFLNCFINKKKQKKIYLIFYILSFTLTKEQNILQKQVNNINSDLLILIQSRLTILEDIIWCLNKELIENFKKIKKLTYKRKKNIKCNSYIIFKQINTILNSIDRLEVRGRDSAGISILFLLSTKTFKKFKIKLKQIGLISEFIHRQNNKFFINKNINCNKTKTKFRKNTVSITITYKIALEIGNLGDNTNFIRQEITDDCILYELTNIPFINHTISSHTRWASVGGITEHNCHPINNISLEYFSKKKHTIHVCLNGEIDNYLELKKNIISNKNKIEKITTDTKIIPIKIEKYIKKGFNITNAFRLAVNTFKGSHAITIHTDLAPGKILIAQKGSGQSMFIGLGENSYMPVSEVYGFVEETNKFLRMQGDKIVKNKNNNMVQGQIFILDQEAENQLNNIKAISYDGTPLKLTKKNIKTTKITTKDTDRKGYRHYFLKEIYESPSSVKHTLNGKWDIINNYKTLKINKKTFPIALQKALKLDLISHIFFIGQGTAGIAAKACSNILKYFLNNSKINIAALKASELSGFAINQLTNTNLNNTLVIAVTQSGNTTDTNRTIDIVNSKNAHTVAIVNRRDSDITFRVDGVMHTSTGRDIEMSVASTKAFYSQIIAGSILCLQIASLTKMRSKKFISNQIEELLQIPKKMDLVLKLEKTVKKSVKKLAAKKKYWATVGSGPNKASADEIRIKLSELCYKTISSDYIEDKKHIDLSSEPLILICAAGLKREILKDIIKDTAIFKAHKAIPIVITNKNELRFEPYADYIFYVPKIPQHFAPILNTLVGHMWGYHAALLIDKSSKLLNNFRNNIQNNINKYTSRKINIPEIINKESFRNKISSFYYKLRNKMLNDTSFIKITNSTNLILLLKYLSGKLPISDFEIDFNKKPTATNMLNYFFKTIDHSINDMSRPIDAIKHQAKIVTVGTSRINTTTDGILFEIIKDNDILIRQLSNRNLLIIKNLQKTVKTIQGHILYAIPKTRILKKFNINNINTKIKTINKSGIVNYTFLKLENNNQIKKINNIILTQEKIYIKKDLKNNQNIIIIPLYSELKYESNKICYLLLINIKFKKAIKLKYKIKVLGKKYNNIKNIIQKNNIPWNDNYIDNIKINDLLILSAKKIAKHIISKQNKFNIFNLFKHTGNLI